MGTPLSSSKPITLREHYTHLRTLLDEGRTDYGFVVQPDGQVHACDFSGRIDIVCGSFNPLHEAHKAMYHGVTRFQPPGMPAARAFEISLYRHQKPFLTFDDLAERLKQFEWYAPVIVTGVARFAEKIKAIGHNASPIFHVGYDTAERLLNTEPRETVEGMRCAFVVYQRQVDGRTMWVDNLPYIPNNFMSGRLPEHVTTLSSTGMREHSFSVAWAILRDHNHFLLVQRAPHDDYPYLWCFPGGGIENGEGISVCAARELLEETGYAPENFSSGKDVKVTHVEPDGRTMQVFGVRMQGVESRIPMNCPDIAGMGWFLMEELDAMREKGMLAPATIKVLEAMKDQ